jgi:hypothetical protein
MQSDPAWLVTVSRPSPFWFWARLAILLLVFALALAAPPEAGELNWLEAGVVVLIVTVVAGLMFLPLLWLVPFSSGPLPSPSWSAPPFARVVHLHHLFALIFIVSSLGAGLRSVLSGNATSIIEAGSLGMGLGVWGALRLMTRSVD